MIEPSELKPYARFVARFEPLRTDDLRPGLAQHIGREFKFMAAWMITEEDGGSYVGQWACTPDDLDLPHEDRLLCGWSPSCDLVMVERLTEGLDFDAA